jgi:hypothetical protein
MRDNFWSTWPPLTSNSGLNGLPHDLKDLEDLDLNFGPLRSIKGHRRGQVIAIGYQQGWTWLIKRGNVGQEGTLGWMFDSFERTCTPSEGHRFECLRWRPSYRCLPLSRGGKCEVPRPHPHSWPCSPSLRRVHGWPKGVWPRTKWRSTLVIVALRYLDRTVAPPLRLKNRNEALTWRSTLGRSGHDSSTSERYVRLV